MNKNQHLKVDLVNNGSKIRNKNAFANSFVFKDDFTNDNQFAGLRETLNLKEQNHKQPSHLPLNDSRLSKPNPQPKPVINQSLVKQNLPKLMIEEQQQHQNSQEQEPSPRKKKDKKQKRKLFDQSQMNNTFLVEQQQSNVHKDKDFSKKQTNQSPQKNTQTNHFKSKNQTIVQEQKTLPLKSNPKQKNKEKTKNQTIEIEQQVSKNNLKPQQNPSKDQFPSHLPSKPPKNTFQIQTLQTPTKPAKQPYKIIQNPLADKQLTKISQITSNHKKIGSDIKDIRQNYDSIEAEEEILFKKHNPRRQHEIRDFLMQKRMEKEHRQKKINQIRERQKEAIAKSIEESERLKQKEKDDKIRKIKQTDYIRPKHKRELIQQSNEQGTRLASQLIQKYSQQQPIHVRREREFEEIQRHRKQQEQELLLERKHRYQSLDLQELEEHKREYEERKEEIESLRKEQREEQWNKINEDNQLLRDNIWKGPSHDIVDEERMEMRRRKKEPKEKVKKMKNYYEYIKQNFLPKTHQPRHSPAHDQRVSETMGDYSGRYQGPPNEQLGYDPYKKHVKKFKYYQGRAVGQVVEIVSVARSYSEQKKIGEGYLQHLRSLPKKRDSSESTTEIDPLDLEMISRKFNAVTKVKRQAVPFYEDRAVKRTVSISAKPSKEEVKMVYDLLKNEDIKLKSKRQLIRVMKQNSPGSVDMQRDFNAGMLLNMERKLDLLAKL